jgi:hypothetical protein
MTALWACKFASRYGVMKFDTLIVQPVIQLQGVGNAISEAPKGFAYFEDLVRALRQPDPLELVNDGRLIDPSKADGWDFGLTADVRKARNRRLVFASRVEALSLAQGVLETFSNPRANILALRKFLSSRPVPGRDRGLTRKSDTTTTILGLRRDAHGSSMMHHAGCSSLGS